MEKKLVTARWENDQLQAFILTTTKIVMYPFRYILTMFDVDIKIVMECKFKKEN